MWDKEEAFRLINLTANKNTLLSGLPEKYLAQSKIIATATSVQGQTYYYYYHFVSLFLSFGQGFVQFASLQWDMQIIE